MEPCLEDAGNAGGEGGGLGCSGGGQAGGSGGGQVGGAGGGQAGGSGGGQVGGSGGGLTGFACPGFPIPDGGFTHPAITATATRLPLPAGAYFGIAISRAGVIYLSRFSPSNAVLRRTVANPGADAGFHPLMAPGGVTLQLELDPAETTLFIGMDNTNLQYADVATMTPQSVPNTPNSLFPRARCNGTQLYVGTESRGFIEHGPGPSWPAGRVLGPMPLFGQGLWIDEAADRLYAVSAGQGATNPVISIDLNDAGWSQFFVPGKTQQIFVDGDVAWISIEGVGVELWSLDAGTRLANLTDAGEWFAMTPSRDGVELWAAGVLGEVAVMDRVSRTLKRRLQLGTARLRRIAFSPAGETAYIVDENAGLYLIR